MALRINQFKFDNGKTKILKVGLGLQLIGTHVRVYFLEECHNGTAQLFINIKERGYLLIDNRIAPSNTVDATGGFLKDAYEMIVQTDTAEDTTALKKYMEYLREKNQAWVTSKVESKDDYNDGKVMNWPEADVGGANVNEVDEVDEVVLNVDVNEDLSKGMRASTKQFMDKNGPRTLLQRLHHYRNGDGPKHGFYGPWACPYKERPPKAPQLGEDINDQEMTVDHLVIVHKTKTNGSFHKMVGTTFTANTTVGDLHTTCSCHCTTQPIRMDNGQYATNEERKQILIGLGLPGNDPTVTTDAPRIRLPNPDYANDDEDDDDDDDDDDGAAATNNTIVAPTAMNTLCSGIDGVCASGTGKKRSTNNPKTPLGMYCTGCTRSILKLTVANAKECLLNGVAGDTAPTWWKEAYALSEKAKPSVVKCRYQYCRCIMKGVQQALLNEINKNNDEDVL